MSIWENKNLIKILKAGGVVIMPTDTIYGLVSQALNSTAVKNIFSLKKRDLKKPGITLIGSLEELKKFSIILSEKQEKLLKKYWPGPGSIILDCPVSKNFFDNNSLIVNKIEKTMAFRLPASTDLQNLLLEVGPLFSSSVNLEGLPPAQNIAEAKKYFGKEKLEERS